MDSTLTLGYWPIRGLAEPLRFFLNYVNLPFVDKKYDDPNEWVSVDKPAFNNKLANLPYLKDGDQAFFETDSLFYVIANKANRLELVGKDGEQMAKVAVARSVIKEVHGAIMSMVYDKVNFNTKKPVVLAGLKKQYAAFEDILSKSDWVAGDSITYVDFTLWELTDELVVMDPNFLEEFPHVAKWHQRFIEVPQNKAYVASEKYIAKPFNNPNHAAWY